MCCLSGGSGRGQVGVSTALCPGTEDIYSREKIKRRTENTEVREGDEEFTGSSTVENTGEVTAGLLRMKQVSVPSIHCQ